MRRRYIFVAIVILLLIAGSAFGFRYVSREMPQVSNAETIDALEEYAIGLKSCYEELNIEFEKNGGDAEAWATFSGSWFQKLSNAKPDSLDKRIPKGHATEKEDLFVVNRKIVNLWQEYNSAAEGSTINQEQVDEIKTMMDGYFREAKK